MKSRLVATFAAILHIKIGPHFDYKLYGAIGGPKSNETSKNGHFFHELLIIHIIPENKHDS